jgi:hypothetical protein
MNLTIPTALVFTLGLVPGVLGALVYRLLNGVDWRDREMLVALRWFGFSVFGLGVYSLLAVFLDLIPALHVLPSSYASSRMTASSFPALFVPFLGHCLTSASVGAAAAGIMRLTSKTLGLTVGPCSWDEFATKQIKDRWVVLTLKSGDAYAGQLLVVDTSVAGTDRDLVLRDPAKWNPETNSYCRLHYRDLFVPAALLESIATVYDPDKDRDATPPGQPLFADSHDRQVASIQTPATVTNVSSTTAIAASSAAATRLTNGRSETGGSVSIPSELPAEGSVSTATNDA